MIGLQAIITLKRCDFTSIALSSHDYVAFPPTWRTIKFRVPIPTPQGRLHPFLVTDELAPDVETVLWVRRDLAHDLMDLLPFIPKPFLVVKAMKPLLDPPKWLQNPGPPSGMFN